MTHITYIPQQMNANLAYSIDGEVIIATMDGQSEAFDFSSMPNGEATEIISTLDPCPVLSAKRVDGELHVTLLRSIPARPNDPEELEAWKRLWTDDLEVVIGG